VLVLLLFAMEELRRDRMMAMEVVGLDDEERSIMISNVWKHRDDVAPVLCEFVSLALEGEKGVTGRCVR